MNQYDEDLESAVLGAILLEPDKLTLVAPILKAEYFHHRSNQIIYTCIMQMQAKRDHIDILTVSQALKTGGRLEDVGGAYYISSLTNRVGSAASIEHHVRIIHQFYILRELTKLGEITRRKSESVGADCFDIIDDINKRLSELTDLVSTKIPTVGDIFVKMVSDISSVIEGGIKPGIPSGLTRLDNYTGGWQNGDLIVVAARPGMGKSAFALQCAKYPAVTLNKPTAIFSLEMKDERLVGRLAASESMISSSKINQKAIDRKELQDMGARCMKLIDAPIYIDDTPAMKFMDLRAKARRLKDNHKIELLIVDYLQLAHGDEKGNREQEISYITRNLKSLAKELNIPIIALSQLSRQVENREGKRPQLSDLRESGAIEQDADMVCFIFRPAEYKELDVNKTGYDYKGELLPTDNLMILDIAKGRELATGELMLKFYGEFMIVTDYSPDYASAQFPASKPLPANSNFLDKDDF